MDKLENHVSTFERTLQKSEAWIGEMHKELKWLSADSVYHLLRAVLQTLRDQLNTNEAAHFAAQLPLLLRGTFYDGWNPQPAIKKTFTKEEFLETVQQKMNPIKYPNFDLEKGVHIALKVILKHISQGEVNDIVSTLKPSLRLFFKNCQESPLQYYGRE